MISRHRFPLWGILENLLEGGNRACILTSTFYYCREKRKRKISLASSVSCAGWKWDRKMPWQRRARKLGKFEAGWWKLRSYQSEIVSSRPRGSIRRLVGNFVDSKLDLKIAVIEYGRTIKRVDTEADDGLTHDAMILVLPTSQSFDFYWHMKFNIGVNKATAECWILIILSSESSSETRWSGKWLSRLERNSNVPCRLGHDLNVFACY